MKGWLGEFLVRHHRLSGVFGAVAHRTTGFGRWRSQAGHCWYCALTLAGIDRVAPGFMAEAEAESRKYRVGEPAAGTEPSDG